MSAHVYLLRTRIDGILTDAVYSTIEAAEAAREALPPGRGWSLTVAVPVLASPADVAAHLASKAADAAAAASAPMEFKVSAQGTVKNP